MLNALHSEKKNTNLQAVHYTSALFDLANGNILYYLLY